MRRVPFPALAVLIVVGSGCRPTARPPELSPEPRLDAFARALERSLEAHAWNEILAVADPDHHRVQVTEHGMPEPQYVAELFGLHGVDNDIRRGQAVSWSDLERIEDVRLREITREGGRSTLTGEVRLPDGDMLRLEAWIVESDGELRLTGGVG